MENSQNSFQKCLGSSRNIHPNLHNIPWILNVNSQNLHLNSSQNLPDSILKLLDLVTSLLLHQRTLNSSSPSKAQANSEQLTLTSPQSCTKRLTGHPAPPAACGVSVPHSMSWVSRYPLSLQCCPSPRPPNMQVREGSPQLCSVFPAAVLPAAPGHHRSKGPHATGAPPLPEHKDLALCKRTCFHREFCPHPTLLTASQELSLPYFSNAPPTQRGGCLLRQRCQCCERLPWGGEAQSRWLRGRRSAGSGRRAGCWGQGPGDAKRRDSSLVSPAQPAALRREAGVAVVRVRRGRETRMGPGYELQPHAGRCFVSCLSDARRSPFTAARAAVTGHPPDLRLPPAFRAQGHRPDPAATALGPRGRQSHRSPPSAARRPNPAARPLPPSERNHIRKVFGVFLAAFNAISQLEAGGASPRRPDHREGPARRRASAVSRGRQRAAGGAVRRPRRRARGAAPRRGARGARGEAAPASAGGGGGWGVGGAAGAARLLEPLARGWRGRRLGLELPPPPEPRPGDVMGGRYKISASGPGERQCALAGRCGAVLVYGPGHDGQRNARARRTARRQRSRLGEKRGGATLPGAKGRAPGDVGRGARRGHEWCSERGGRGAPPAAAGRCGPLTRAAARRGGAPPAPRGAGRRMGKERGAARHGACRFSLRSAASSSWKS